MHFKNDGLTVGELSITIAALIIIFFTWTSISKNEGNQDVSIFVNNASELVYPKQNS